MKNQGFTLIEVLVAAAIIGILSIGIVSLQSILGQNQLVVWRNYLNVEETNRAVSTMVREIRNARPGDNGAYALELANDQELVFYSDIDLDNQTEKVRYTLNGTEFTKGVIEPVGTPATYPEDQEKTNVLTENVRNGSDPIFYYYNGDWPEDTTNNPLDTPTRLSDTKLMKVYLELNTDEDEPDKDYILESYTQIRTVKENL